MPFRFNDEYEKTCIDTLNRYFPTKPFEKHPKAMMRLIFDRSVDKILGKNFRKERISGRKQKLLYDAIRREIRAHYGPYVNVTHFKAKDPSDIRFDCNVHRVYSTPFGNLYGAPSHIICRDVFFTSHCFDRLNQRIDPISRAVIKGVLEPRLKANPTPADICFFLINHSTFEYGKRGNTYFLHALAGVIVLDRYPEFFVAKTYLLPDMLYEGISWYKPTLTVEEDRNPYELIGNLGAILDHKPVKIDLPSFIEVPTEEELKDAMLDAVYPMEVDDEGKSEQVIPR